MIRYLPLLLLVAGCAQTPAPSDGANNPGTAMCNADALTDLVGNPATADLGADALRRSGARTLRWLQPNSMQTMDFRQDRLNIELDDANKVSGFRCG